MNILGSRRSLAAGLDLAARVAWILGLAGGMVLLLAIVLGFVGVVADDAWIGPRLAVWIHGGEHGPTVVRARTEGAPDARLIVERGTVSVPGVQPGLYVAIYAFGALTYGLTLLILHRLMRVTSTLAAGRPFVPDNAVRIRTIGLAVTAIWCGERIGDFAIQQFVRSRYTLDHGSFAWMGDPDLAVLFLALLILVLSEVFRIGTALQEDHDATN